MLGPVLIHALDDVICDFLATSPEGASLGIKEDVVGNGSITGVSVTIADNQIADMVYGAQITTTGAGNVTANDNLVIVDGGTVNETIYGGYAMATTGAATASNNTVDLKSGTLKKNEDGSGVVNVYGGHAEGAKTESENNTLKVHNPFTVNSVQDFQNYEFYIPVDVSNVNALLTGTSPVNLAATDEISVKAIDSALVKGNTVNLINKVFPFACRA